MLLFIYLSTEIGSAIGGGCIYSCAVEHSDCQLGICSCSSGYVEVAGNCITGMRFHFTRMFHVSSYMQALDSV